MYWKKPWNIETRSSQRAAMPIQVKYKYACWVHLHVYYIYISFGRLSLPEGYEPVELNVSRMLRITPKMLIGRAMNSWVPGYLRSFLLILVVLFPNIYRPLSLS